MQEKSIIHFSGDDYWISNPHSRYHISKAFHKKGYKILWISQVGFHFPSVRKSGSNALKKILRKLRSYLKVVKKVEDGFYVYTPLIVPKFKEGRIQKINDVLLKLQVKFLQLILNFNNPVLFFSTPLYGKAIEFIKHEKSFYYYSDKYTEARVLNNESRNLIKNLDALLYIKSDVLFCASKLLTDYVTEKSNRKAYYLPHGVDVEHFSSLNSSCNISDIERISKPVIGYFGSITAANDWDLIKYCAERRPEYSFVFVGRKEINLPELERMDNIYFLGKKDYSSIPYYGSYFDVCISFWVIKDWIKNSSPLKIKEYMALGKPVVSIDIDEVRNNFADVVYIASSYEGFLENIDKAVTEDNTVRIKKGRDRVNEESWIKIVEQIESTLK